MAFRDALDRGMPPRGPGAFRREAGLGMTRFTPPTAPLDPDDLSAFCSGQSIVDEWAHKRAHRAARQGTAVAYVVRVDGFPVGLYSLSAHSVLGSDMAGGWLRRNVPEHIPAVLLGMLGVDRGFQGMGLGKSLLRDAILRSRHVSEEIGARALLVDPADDGTAGFYERYGFEELSRTDRLFLPLA